MAATSIGLLSLLGSRPRKVKDVGPAGGRVRLDGTVALRDPALRSPFSGTSCAYYFVEIFGALARDSMLPWGPGGEGTRVYLNYNAAGFSLLTGTDRVRVMGEAGSFVIGRGHRRRGHAAKEELHKVIDARTLDTYHSFLFEERVLAAGARVAVFGEARWEARADGEIGGAYREVPRGLVLDSPAVFTADLVALRVNGWLHRRG